MFEGVLGFCTSVVGPEMGRKAFPVVATIFFFVLFNAWLALLPFLPVPRVPGWRCDQGPLVAVRRHRPKHAAGAGLGVLCFRGVLGPTCPRSWLLQEVLRGRQPVTRAADWANRRFRGVFGGSQRAGPSSELHFPAVWEHDCWRDTGGDDHLPRSLRSHPSSCSAWSCWSG